MKDKASLLPLGNYIVKCQNSAGAIAWEPDGKIDPWDHTESIMGLNVLGMEVEAKAGFDWLKSCLLYTSPSPRDVCSSRMPSSA